MFRKIASTAGNSFIIPVRNYARKSGNPGMNRMIDNFNESKEIEEDPEGFGDIESDFMQAHEMHKIYEKELVQHREKIKHLIVKNKYFKVQQPNFLTYAEKEQIKLLHTRDPEEWNPDKLADSFPADSEVITKIIKANWVPQSETRIRKHDQTVVKNWSLFKEGKLTNIDGRLKEHLQKFVARKENDLKNITITKEVKPELPKPTINEFSSIITSCKNQAANTKKLIEDNSTSRTTKSNLAQQVEDETYLTDKIIKRRPMRFRDLKQQMGDKGEEPSPDIRSKDIVKQTSFDDHLVLGAKKLNVTEVELNAKDLINLTNDHVREKIRIPSKVWKKGSTYKVKDCYYDDDGVFLYRVPGMTGV